MSVSVLLLATTPLRFSNNIWLNGWIYRIFTKNDLLGRWVWQLELLLGQISIHTCGLKNGIDFRDKLCCRFFQHLFYHLASGQCTGEVKKKVHNSLEFWSISTTFVDLRPMSSLSQRKLRLWYVLWSRGFRTDRKLGTPTFTSTSIVMFSFLLLLFFPDKQLICVEQISRPNH